MPKAPAKKATSAAVSTRKRPSTAKKNASQNGTTRTTRSKPVSRKTTARKSPAKKSPAKKTTTAKKSPVKKSPAKKTTAAKRSPVKKSPAKKTTAAKRSPVKKSPAKKTTAAKRSPAKKSSAKKAAAAKKAGTTRPAGARAASRLAVRADEKPWTAGELREVRDSLNTEVDRLRSEILDAEVEIADLFRDGGEGAGHDQADVGSTTFERDHEMSLANHSREMLTQIEHALERIDDGTYGICESCGNPVGKLRLMAFPRATLCVSCKQRQERR